MDIENTQVTKLKLTNLDALDPVSVFTEDFGESQGQITITCYGKAWTSYWGGMGDRSIIEFFCGCDEYYLAKNLSDISSTVIDYDVISEKLGFEVERETLAMAHKDMVIHYGEDWCMDLPQTSNSDYEYLCRIIKAVQAALNTRLSAQAA